MGIEGSGNNYNNRINNENKFIKNDNLIRKEAEEFKPLFPISDDEPDCHALYAVQIPEDPEEQEPGCHAVYAVQIPDEPEEQEPGCHALYAVQIPDMPSKIDLPDLPPDATEPSISAVYAIQIPDAPEIKIETPKLPKIEPDDLPKLETGKEDPITKFMEMIQKILEKLLNRE